ncbi:MAG TPA: hypothetical protein VN833_00435 [Candidatus Acidoferrales bacterium]|jgi:phosphoglucomutase|nr:hypothetical protein [Candidatus Acidoferrales bacterium]
MKTQIKFATSGWRAVMAEEFTLANVRRAQAGLRAGWQARSHTERE